MGTTNRNINISKGDAIDQIERDRLPDWHRSRGYDAPAPRGWAMPWQAWLFLIGVPLLIGGYLIIRFVSFISDLSYQTSWLDVWLIGTIKVALFLSPVVGMLILLYWLYLKAADARVIRLQNNMPIARRHIERDDWQPAALASLGAFYATEQEWAKHSGMRSLNQLDVSGMTAAPQIASADTIDAEPLDPFELALSNVPRLVDLEHIIDSAPGSMSVPIGVDQTGAQRWLDLRKGILHVGIFGGSGAGKDNLLESWFLALAKNNAPDRVQFAVLDGKGHWMKPVLNNLAHMWMPPAGGIGAEGQQALEQTLRAIQTEAARRGKIVFGANCDTMEQYTQKTGQPMPYLVVMISDVMGNIVADVDRLLVDLVSKARALGIRVFVSMQTPTKQNTQWRTNLSTVLAAQMQQPSNDAPALGLNANDMQFPPSRLPDPQSRPGLFSVRNGRDQFLIQAPLVRKPFLAQCVAELPTRVQIAQQQPARPVVSANAATSATLRATATIRHDSAPNAQPATNAPVALRSATPVAINDAQRDYLVKTLRRHGKTQDAIRDELKRAGITIAQGWLVALCQEVDRTR